MRLSEAPPGSCDDDEEGALVVLGQEAGRRLGGERIDAGAGDADHDEADHGNAHEPRDDGAIAVAHPVDRAHHPADDAAARAVMALQQHAAQRGRQGQRIDRRQEHRDRDGHRELAEQLAGNARDEGDRHEDRHQDQRDGDDRRGDFGHGLLGRLGGRQVGIFLHHALDILDHHDGVVDHDADGQHDGQQRHRIGRIADRLERDEGADQADRHGERRDERGADAAEEQKDDEHDEDEGLDQRLLHFVNRVGDEGRRVVGDLPGDVVGKGLFQCGNLLLHRIQRRQRIGARRLVDRDGRGRRRR